MKWKLIQDKCLDISWYILVLSAVCICIFNNVKLTLLNQLTGSSNEQL